MINIFKLNKKASNISIIVSMVLFVGFVIFLYFISQPVFTNKTDKQVIIDYLEVKLKSEISSPLNILSISIDDGYVLPPGAENCVYIPNREEDFIVKNWNGNIISSNKDSGKVNFYFNSNKNFRIYFFNYSFDHTLTEEICDDIVKDVDYFIKADINDSLISVEKFSRFSSLYETNYKALVTYLKVPLNSDFSFNFIYNNGTIIGPNLEDKNLNVFSENFPVRYLTKNGNQQEGILRISVW